MKITSSAFRGGERIPRKYTQDGEDVSPPLTLEDVPAGARSLALIVDDPDAPNRTWVHWLLWDLPVALSELPEGVPTDRTVPGLENARQGVNDFDRIGWGGPLPPRGHGTHHYRFTLLALKEPLGLDPGADRAALEAALEGRVLARARLTGTYERE